MFSLKITVFPNRGEPILPFNATRKRAENGVGGIGRGGCRGKHQHGVGAHYRETVRFLEYPLPRLSLSTVESF